VLIIISPILITELICGLLEPYLKFKIPISIYCSSIYLPSTLLKVVCVIVNCVCVINQIISLLLKVFVYVIRLIPGLAAKQDFLKVRFICSCVLRDMLWCISKRFKKFCPILTCHLSGKWWIKLYTVWLKN